MGRQSSIIGTPIQARIDAMLDAGETLTEIRSETGASLSALSRYNQYRKSHIARVIDSESNIFDLIGRLQQAADDARDARRHAQRSGGSAAARARAISTEAALLGRLLDSLGVDDSRVSDELESAFGLITAVAEHVEHDETSVSIIDRIRTRGLADVADALERRLRGAHHDN